MTMNGALAGLVAITASCDVVNDYEALFIWSSCRCCRCIRS